MIFFKIIILRSTLTHASIRYYYNMLPIYQPIQAVNGFGLSTCCFTIIT